MVDTLLEPNKDILKKIYHHVATDVGIQRDNNQDNFVIVNGKNFKLYVVCDGMGGVDGGEIASKLVVSYIEDCLSGKEVKNIDKIVEVVIEANKVVFNYGMKHQEVKGLGTTITAMFVTQRGSWVLNVGDSRIYKIVDSSINQITEDNTIINELVKSGAVTNENVKEHPITHMLTRTVGQGKNLEVDTKRIGFLNANEKYLLCSDGLYNMISNDDILLFIEQYSPDNVVKKLIDKANQNGGVDNITVMVIGVNEKIIQEEVKEDIMIESRKISEGLNIDELQSQFKKDKEFIGKDVNIKSNESKKIKFTTYFLILFSLLILLSFKIFSGESKEEKFSVIDKDEEFVEEIGKIEVKDERRNIKIKLFSRKANSKDDSLLQIYAEQERESYNKLLEIIDSNEQIDDKDLQNEIENENNNITILGSEINEILENLKALAKYNGENLIKVGRELSRESQGVKDANDDFIKFSYELINESNTYSQEKYEEIKDNKLDLLEKEIKDFVNDRSKELNEQLFIKQLEKEFRKSFLSILNLKQELINLRSEGNQEKILNFRSKVEMLKQRNDTK